VIFAGEYQLNLLPRIQGWVGYITTYMHIHQNKCFCE